MFDQLQSIQYLQDKMQFHKLHPDVKEFIDYTDKLYHGLMKHLEKTSTHIVAQQTQPILEEYAKEHIALHKALLKWSK